MKIEQININEIKPYAKNPRKNDNAVMTVVKSIQEYGFQQPIVVDKDMTIVVGHTRYRAAKHLSLQTVPVLVADNLTPDQVQAYRIMDNRSNENAEWDNGLLVEELQEVVKQLGDITLTGFSKQELSELLGDIDDALIDDTYTKKIDTPIYEPKGEKPSVTSLFDDSHAKNLISSIESSSITDEDKLFLINAARRHVVFDYHQIAEYYCHASKEVQELMEDSALVIIDVEKAIENGYVSLTDELKEIYTSTYGDDDGLR